MRALKSLLLTSGDYRRMYPLEDELKLVIEAIELSNIPKFLNKDLPLFYGIIKDLFPRFSMSSENNVEL